MVLVGEGATTEVAEEAEEAEEVVVPDSRVPHSRVVPIEEAEIVKAGARTRTSHALRDTPLTLLKAVVTVITSMVIRLGTA